MIYIICRYVCRGPNCVGGITWPKHAQREIGRAVCRNFAKGGQTLQAVSGGALEDNV